MDRDATSAVDARTSKTRRPRFLKSVAGLTAVVLLLGVAAAYQVGVVNRRPPSFDAGGAFVSAEDLGVAGTDGRPYPYGDATGVTPASPDTAAAPTTAGPASSRTTGAGSTVTGSTVPSAGSTPGTEASPPDTALPTIPVLPATGAYTYSVRGSEGATGFGSRSFPETATIVMHGDPGIGTDERVLDLELSSQHEEREIVRYGADGIAFTYEAGSVTFGPGTQTSQGTYDPPMVQIPWPLADGASRSGSSAAVDGSGNVTRVEHWTATVVGREVLTVLAEPRETWVVDVQRNTDPGSAEQVDRFRRYWYDPSLGTWVRWTERFHGQRNVVFTFTYDADYTAELTAFTPG